MSGRTTRHIDSICTYDMKHFQTDKATDSQLLIEFQESRDERAFAELVRRHGPMVLATVRRVLKSKQDVEDAFQATMFALAKAAGKLHHKAAVGAWLHRTAYRCAIGIQRANARWKQKADRMMERLTDSTSNGQTGEPLQCVANEETESILDEELASLPEKLREVIVLCELEGIPRKTVAKRLGIPTSTVTDRIAKGRKLLQNRLIHRGATLTVSAIAAHAASTRKATAAMIEDLVADVSTKATLYASGKTAAEIGVSTKVVQLADKVTLTMTKAKLITVLLAACAIVVSIGPLSARVGTTDTVNGGEILFSDNFDDRNDDGWEHIDFAAGSPWGPGIYDASSTEYRIQTTDVISPGGTPLTTAVFAAQRGDESFANGYLQVDVRANSDEGNVSLVLRNVEGEGAGFAYNFHADVSRNEIRIELFEGGAAELLAIMSPAPFPLVAGEDWTMKAGAVGDDYSMKIWRRGESEPAHPQLSVRHDVIESATRWGVGVTISGDSAGIQPSATFDNVTFFVAEPVSHGAFLFGVLCLAPFFRRQ